MPAGRTPIQSDFEQADLWPSLSEALRHAQVLARPDRQPWLQTSSGIMDPAAILEHKPPVVGPDGQIAL
jgi:hypothetical protein